ncbi:MAG: NUDIX hydrolase [Ilumatobacteraceae bacterium]|nr:NUDIX hydrolase [Ilumatobacteraceae bacterium]
MSDTSSEEFDPTTVPVKPAATVLLVRDADAGGVEVFMLRRTFNAAFASGMFVFPGGKVDDVDGVDEIAELCDGLTDTHASSLLGIANGGLAYWVACIRECFEEAGVLLARHETTGDVVRFDDEATAQRFEVERENIHDGSVALLDLCKREGLRLTTDDIHYVSHWITPMGEKRRFDTRFFIARAPQAQEPLHDDGETIESFWISPQEAIERAHERDLMLMPPTKANIEFLLPFKTADEVLAAAAQVGMPQTILPKLKIDSDGRVVGIAMPGDPEYAVL